MVIAEKISAGDVGAEWIIDCLEISSAPANISPLRKRVMELLKELPFSEQERADVETALGEACANALRHGSTDGTTGPISVKCMRNASTVILEVADTGCGFDPDILPVSIPGTLREGGMGIFIIRKLADKVEFEFNNGTTVRITKYCKSGS